MSDSKETFARVVAEQGDKNQLLKAFDPNNLVNPDDQNTFECRGCGLFCCVDKTIVLRPSEYYRIVWFLERQMPSMLNEPWVAFITGEVSGLPVAWIEFEPTEVGGPSVCPFLIPEFDEAGKLNFPLARCGIYPVRPVACRIYPYGRCEIHEPETGAILEVITVAERCAGFEIPPKHVQSVADFLQTARPEDLREEIDFCNQLLFSLVEIGLHKRSLDNPTSLLPEGSAFNLLAPLLYKPPLHPEDPKEDHKVIMEHLHGLEIKRDQLVEIFTEVANGELSLSEGMDWATALVA